MPEVDNFEQGGDEGGSEDGGGESAHKDGAAEGTGGFGEEDGPVIACAEEEVLEEEDDGEGEACRPIGACEEDPIGGGEKHGEDCEGQEAVAEFVGELSGIEHGCVGVGGWVSLRD